MANGGDSQQRCIPKLTREQDDSDCYHSDAVPMRIKFIVFSTTKPVGCEIKKYYRTGRDLASLKPGLFEKFKKMEDDVEIMEDLPIQDFKKYIKDLDTEKSLKKYNCFFFIFLTFASKSRLHFADGALKLEDIVESIQISPFMVGWPKVFLVQSDDLSLIETPQGPEKEEIKKLPTDADRLVVLSTVPIQFASQLQYPKGNSHSNCSFLIQAFLSALEENTKKDQGNRLDLLSLTVDVNSRFADLLAKLAKDNPQAAVLPLPLTTSTLRKLLYL